MESRKEEASRSAENSPRNLKDWDGRKGGGVSKVKRGKESSREGAQSRDGRKGDTFFVRSQKGKRKKGAGFPPDPR